MSASAPILSLSQIGSSEQAWVPVGERPLVGKDILELLSSSMYVTPLSIYREYIQNSADSIDEARKLGLLAKRDAGKVDLEIDPARRQIRIRDNGTGLENREFTERLIAFGGSKKRGLRARGFRGVGRLAGLGYCQELVFRSRTEGEDQVSELRWDCRKLKSVLRSTDSDATIEGLVSTIVTSRRVSGRGYPRRFFEVELSGIIRHRNDLLLNSTSVQDYLAQVAPVPFSPDFSFRDEIQGRLQPHVALGDVSIHVNDSPIPVYRPHKNEFEVRKGLTDVFGNIEFIEIPANDGGFSGVGWILHHGYSGALPAAIGVKGLRLRIGNMQIGECSLFDELFPEPRFNSWVVGEVHVLDSRILPNGRRDNLEQNIHCQNLMDHLAAHAHALSRRCRASSAQRNWARQFEQNLATIQEIAAILRQAAITGSKRVELKEQIENRIDASEKIAERPILGPKLQSEFRKQIATAKSMTDRLFRSQDQHKKLMRLERGKRELAAKVFDLIYELNKDRASAKALVERILRRL